MAHEKNQEQYEGEFDLGAEDELPAIDDDRDLLVAMRAEELQQARRRWIAKRLAIYAVLAVLAWWLVRNTETYLNIFGLKGENTVYDYQAARLEVAVHWTVHICKNGECITPRDWACGYEVDSGKVYECFMQRVDTVPVWWKLDRLRKECGQAYMAYTGAYFNAERCQKLGGPPQPSQPNDLGSRNEPET